MKAKIDFTKASFNSKTIPEHLVTDASVLFNVNGALEIKNAFPKSLIKRLQKEFWAQYFGANGHRLKRYSSKVGDKRFLTAVQINGLFNDPGLYAPRKVLPVLRTLLGNDCVLHAFGAITALPGAKMQHFHSDHPRLFGETDHLETFFPPYAIHVSIPLLDLDETTGTTALWEGSHRKKTDQNQDPDKMQEGENALKGASLPYANAGDCVLMDFRLWHRGTENRSNKIRTFLYMVYSRSWFNDNTNYPKQKRLKITNKEFAKIPTNHRHLFAQRKG